MKRIVVFLAMALMAFSVAQAESEQDSTFVFGPADTETAAPELTPSPTPASTPIPTDSGDSGFDFSQVDNPLATPVAVNPIDMPPPTPTPAPNYAYETYKNDSMGISFDIPYTWLLNPATNQETTIQFVEPKSERMEVDGYQTRLTVEKFSAGLSQTASDARTRLESVITELGGMFTTFKTGEIASASIGGANGYYCYYSATYNDGTKDYSMRGRLVVVAHDKDLFQVRLTAPSAWYSYYNHVYRQLRSSFKFL